MDKMKFELDKDDFQFLLFIYGLGIARCEEILPELTQRAFQVVNKMNANNPKWQKYKDQDIIELIDRIQRIESEAFGSEKKPN